MEKNKSIKRNIKFEIKNAARKNIHNSAQATTRSKVKA